MRLTCVIIMKIDGLIALLLSFQQTIFLVLAMHDFLPKPLSITLYFPPHNHLPGSLNQPLSVLGIQLCTDY